jgi:hypothetical protein
MGISEAVGPEIWTAFLTAVVRSRSQPTLEAVIATWKTVVAKLLGQ